MFALVGYLREEAQLGEQHHINIGKPDIRGVAAQRMHLGLSASGGDGEQEGRFPGQVLEQAGRSGSNGALVKATRTNSRHWAGVIIHVLGVFKTFNPSLKHRVLAKRTAMDHCMPRKR